jgi:hypothetical protein
LGIEFVVVFDLGRGFSTERNDRGGKFDGIEIEKYGRF